MGIREEWNIRTRAAMPRSAELKKVDSGIQIWITRGAGAGSANLKALWADYQAWETAKPAEFQKVKAAADELQSEMAKFWKPPQAGIAVKSTGTVPIGWTLVGEGDPATQGCAWLADNMKVGALTGSEIQRINEAFRRARFGAEAARDALIKVRQAGFNTSTAPAKQAYLDFFGSYDEKRFTKVLDNLTALALAFGNSPNVTDVRNWTLWATTYGGCVRANIVSKSSGPVTLTGKVDILIGRSFLLGGGYSKSTDATVGTLVHEFSHGTFAAVDVPEVDNLGTFGCTRVSDDPTNANFGNSTDPHNHQASTEPDDMLLARHKPEYAVVNADCYGQFVGRVVMSEFS